MEESPQMEPGSVLIAAVVFEASMGFAAVFGGWITDIPVLLSLKWSLHDMGVASVAVLPMLALFFATIRLPQKPFQEIREFLLSYFAPLFRETSVLDLFLISLLSGLAEELLFRGFVQVVVGRYANVATGIVVAGILFGFAHNITRLYMVLAGVTGMYLGFLFQYTGNLSVPVMVHALHNFVAFIYVVRTMGPEEKIAKQEGGFDRSEVSSRSSDENDRDGTDESRDGSRDRD